MVLKLYGAPLSSCSLRVASVLHEKQVPFELVPINIAAAEHKTPEHLEKQPFGQVPYIDDDGFILYESRAICRYICEKYADQGTPLIPKDLKARALFEQAASIESFNFDPYASGMAVERIFKPKFRGVPADDAAWAQHNAMLNAKLDAYERILSKQKYLAGDEITLADLFHVPYGVLATTSGSDAITSRPNVKRWFDSLLERPSYQENKDRIKSTA
ncbi:hypothetical protein AX16_007783 [Volvariella volvacea WC 439]|nr:hypothetical protein AX16_007783 [Volvariella volvacea WC 439]